MSCGRRGCCAALLLAAAAWCAAGPGPPALHFSHSLYNVSISENSPPRTYADSPPATDPLGVQLPAQDARVRFRIRHGDRDKFFKTEEHTVGDFCFLFIRTRAGHSDVLNRERRDSYHLDVRATAQMPDGTQLEADTVVVVEVRDENDLSPLFYPTEYEALVPEDTPLHSSIARVTAEDADIGINGEIYYSLAEMTDRFAIHPTSGVVTITRALVATEYPSHEITILARDRASLLMRGEDAPAARATLVVRVARVNLHAPELRVRHLPELVENSTAEIYAIIKVTDQDSGEHGRIASLEIVDGDPDGHFRVRPSTQLGEYDILVHALLDRETAPHGYNLTLRASDAGQPPRSSYLTLPVTLIDANDNSPVFSREIYEANIPETAPPNTPVIRLKVSDRDEGRNARVYIEIVGGNEGGEFIVNPDTGVLYTAVPLDAEEKSLYTLTVSAIDQGNAGTRKQSSAKVKIAVVDANDNNPVFDKEDMEVTVLENGPSGVVVARVSAKDADSGENAYLSYSIANLQPVPFEIDHFSGAVRTSKILDYESMRREYVLRIRASDWGLPYRRQAEMRLTVRLQDINDNRPQFERVDCVGYLPRRLAIGHEIVTLSAIDFDSGDVVSYRIIGGNEDNCFSLDSSTGVLSLSCDLADVRTETRVLNVTATDGTHFADSASLTLHLIGGSGGDSSALECRDTGVAHRLIELLAAAERSNAPIDFAEDFPLAPSRYGENLHIPEFIDFPVEVKVNESVALGTSLVRLRARDRDLGYNGLLVYAISGGDADSAFRIDPDTGELKVIGYLDRERESEYYLNVTVYDLGVPQRSSSRLLPVTVLDVNDNAPRFEKTLASFRVTENAINGTAIFRANATDRDAGEFSHITYSLSGAGEGEFCVERDTGVLMVCAALDRERQALYELTIRATDGGGLRSEALVRVAVDDVNDNVPRFALSSYSARVREDVPVGTPVAVLEAFDPDLSAGGVITYTLPDQSPDNIVFTVDSTSGTIRTAKLLDYEEKQVYGVTVRATDGGRPALWSEATLVVEVGDVDENRHSPQFEARGALALSVSEAAVPGATAGQLRAADADPPGRDSRLSYYVLDGSGMPHFSVDDTGLVRTLTPLDRETAPHYWLTVCAEDQGLVPRHVCIQVYIEVEDVNELAPWPERAAYSAHVAEQCAAGTHVATVRATDGDASPAPSRVRYAIVAGNPDGLFAIHEDTGEIVTTGRTLDRETAATHALEVSASDGELVSSVRVRVALADLNDHAPAFTQRFYDFRVPVRDEDDEVVTEGAETSAEGEGQGETDSEAEEEDERLIWDEWDEPDPSDIYVATVLALDSDEGENGTVRYSARARGAARGLLRVRARCGRLYAARALALRRRAYDLTVRACDGGRPARCALSRVRVRGVRAGGGRAPRLASPAPLQAAELDAPGFLLALLQATDHDNDALYYDIVDGDPERDFVVGREDGSLVVARRLLWERRARYALNVSVTDGRNTVYTTVNISVINDANEGGVEFEQEQYSVEVSESARAGDAVLTLRARVRAGAGAGAGAGVGAVPRLLYGLQGARAPADASLFRLHELTGVLELARPLDRESAALHELTVWARDQAPRASLAFARVSVSVRGADEHAPAWPRRLVQARVPRTAAPGTLLAALRAADRDVPAELPRYSLLHDVGLFTVDALGDVRLARALPAVGPRDYTLQVRARGPPPAERTATLPLHVLVVEPDGSPPRFVNEEVVCEVYENEPAGTVVATLEARSNTAVWYSLSGGEGMFRLNPAAGVLALAAPLDYETCVLYNLTVTALNMGGGSAEAHVTVHVLDRNEFAPALLRREYVGRVSEAAAPGALVADAGAAPGSPLVLRAADADSAAHQQRAYEILQPAAAALFRVDDTTGALSLAAPLDYERAAVHEFTVKVIDMGNPRLPSDSVAKVKVEVINVNDCAPQFSQSTYEATVLLPTVAGVRVLMLYASDADEPNNASLTFDILECNPDGAFTLTSSGELLVSSVEALRAEHRLRVRVSDGRYSATARVLVRSREPDNAGLAFQKTDYYGSVLENTTKPTTIAVLNVLGAALNEHVEFSILNPTEGFEIGATSGAVVGRGALLDREARTAYTLLVRAVAGPRQARARLHVTVSDANDNCPRFVERPYVAALPAGAPPATSVLRVRALDRDAGDNGEVRYEMKRGNGELFRVDRRTGEITLKQTLEAHNQLYSLVIAAFDGGTPACGAEAEVSVRVWGGGVAPHWPQARYSLRAREDAPPGRELAPRLLATSPLTRPLLYTLQAGAKDLFEVHFDTAPDGENGPCAVVLRGTLDYERAREHELVLRATDGVTGAFADVSVTVQVLDVNDCAPEFTQDEYRATVSEAAAVGDLVLTVLATDNDTGANGNVTYSVSEWDAEEGAGKGAAQFTVSARGEVRVAAALDREARARYHLLLAAADAGRPALRTTAHLLITVEDVNDNAPRMERNVVTALVSAEASRGAALARVAAWDPDAADAPRLHYAITTPAQRALRLHPTSGLLTLADPRAPLPRSLNVSVSDGAHAAFTRVELVPAPANNAAPHFPHLVHEARARENQPPPLLLTTVKAYDEDAGEYGTVTYSIPSARLRETFAVDAHSGALTTRVPLDREARAEWQVPLLASDGGGRLAHTTVRVRVLDLNDCAPSFPLREYRAAVRHDHTPGVPFLTLRAHDADAPDNARLTYSVYEGELHSDASGLFAVDSVTGALSFARNATAFAGRSLQVWVRARDGGGLAGEAPVSLHVLAAGAAPRLKRPPPDLFLREDAPPGTLLAELADVTDDEAPRYRLADSPSRDLFAVDAAGRLMLVAPLDRETAAEHVIGVIAEGPGSPAPSVMVITKLHVLDVNEHAPSFHSQPYVVYLAENTPPNSKIIQLMADDPDSGSNGEVRYSLGEAEGAEGAEGVGGEGQAPTFAVEAHSGWVRLARALDREVRAEHRVALLAADSGSPRRAARGTLIVRLLDYDDCPPLFQQQLYEAEVREDAAAGTVAARLHVADADVAAAPLAYFVAAGDPTARFQLRAASPASLSASPTAELFVARALDREHTPRYNLTVAATDGKFTAYTRVLLTVLDVNDNPPYCTQYRIRTQLAENAEHGSRVAALRVRDDDEPHNARLRFYLTGDNATHFAIHKETGVITVAEELDRETISEYKLVAHAQDRDRPKWECSTELEVSLDDINDNPPRFSAEVYSVTLPEDADIGSLVVKVHATDADLGENSLVRYSFVEEGNEAFELMGDSGIITLRVALDRETQAEHLLRVRASDSGTSSRSATATVRLTVADVNDNPPEFEFKQYHAAVPEMDAVGTEVMHVRATSRDTGVNADVFYSLVAGDDREDFAVDRTNGALTVARPLDFERRRQYFLTVQALDGGTPPLSDHAIINITVLDGNDNAPVFSQTSYGARVREDAAVGTRVLQVIADDADAGANGRVTYAIARGDRDGRFAVDADTGYVSVAAPLDREAMPAYVLELRARDRGLPALEASAFLNIEVLDCNDNPPLFAQTNYTAIIQEDKPLGHTILKFVVEDADAAPNAAPFVFDFQSGNEMGAFRLEQDGYLRSATRFNHRIRDQYVLQVRVFDNGIPPLFSDAWVYIKVIEESHHPPVVTPLEIVINSYLDEFPGGVIGHVFASDRDAYDTFTYALAPVDGAPYPSTDLFEIDATAGTLRAAPRIDVGDYRLNVTVDDGKFVSFAIVHVAVVLISDEMLMQAIVVRFREVTGRDFVLSHRKGFIRAVHEATRCRQTDVVIIGVQSSDNDFEAESERPRRIARQVAQDLDVAFAVRAGDGGGFLPADALRRGLHAHLERLEEGARLVVEELVRAPCGGCEHGACAERVQLRASGARAVASDVFSLVVVPFRLRAECACVPGYDGERCERLIPACASCGDARCELVPELPGYRCCENDADADGSEECRTPAAVAYFPGDAYLAYRLDGGVVDGERTPEDVLTVSLRFRTRRSRGVLLHVAGRVDYAVLELAEGHVQFRMELGGGEVALRAGGRVADGAWHAARLERRGAGVRLTVDGRSARAQAPPRHQLLDAHAARLLLGAALLRHAYATAPEQVTYGFHGCMSDVKIGTSEVPLVEGDTSADGRVQLARRVRVRVAAECPALPPPGACAAYPCLHGGTCRELLTLLEGGDAFQCTCHARFAGRLCELDTDPCASQPCLHGGHCSPERGGFRCECAAGLSGERCERGRWCAAGVCAHGGTCEEGERGPSCRCRGYYGPRCEHDVDECAGEPCLNGATCLNEPGSFRCLCPPDKTGMNCGNPLYSDAVMVGEVVAGGVRDVRSAWRWAVRARWPLCAGGVVLLLLLAACAACVALKLRGRGPAPPAAPLNSALDKAPPPRASKLSNLEASRRERPTSCAEPPPLNNIDTLRSYGSAGDELEGIPPDYLRNLNIDLSDRKPWSEQMHLQTFVDNKIYNDLKGCKRQPRAPPVVMAGAGEPHMVGGYHWDCSDWCGGGALPGISEVAGSERPDSSSPPSPPSPATRARAPRRARARAAPRNSPSSPASPTLAADTDSAPDDLDRDLDTLRFTDANSYLLHPDEYLPAAASDDTLRARGLREPDAASLITMLAEERHSLLGGAGSCSDLSANLCEIEDSEAEEAEGAGSAGGAARHTEV